MKKKIFILAASLILVFSFTYAMGDNSPVPANVASEFNTNFTHASQVNWENLGGYYKASFTENGTTLYAFYTAEADFMGIATSIVSDKLPASLLSQMKSNYSTYWITDLYKMNVKETPGFLVCLENADQKITLKAEGNQGWEIYSVEKK